MWGVVGWCGGVGYNHHHRHCTALHCTARNDGMNDATAADQSVVPANSVQNLAGVEPINDNHTPHDGGEGVAAVAKPTL